MKKKVFALLLAALLLLQVLPFASAMGFSDVSSKAYYAAAVDWAIANDITKGTGGGKFSPNAPCTRGQVVTFLWRAKGSPEPGTTECPFTDVSTKSFCYQAVLWAVENGITTGVSKTSFAPNQACTRGQVVTFLWRTEGQPAPANSAGSFSDIQPKNFFYNAVLWAVENGITTGTGKGKFSPNDACTRGQIVTFLYRDLGGGAEPPMELVSPAFSLMDSFTDDQGHEYTLDYHIPRVNLPGNAIETLNNEIYDFYYDAIQDSYSTLEDYQLPTLSFVRYSWDVRHGILCLIIESEYPMDDHFNAMRIYNILVDEQRQASTEEILQARGMSSSDYLDRCQEALGSYYLDHTWENRNVYFTGNEYQQYFYQTIGMENVESAVPFLWGEDGHLRLLGSYKIPAGGGSFPCVVDLDGYTLNPHYWEMAAAG